MMKNAQYTLKRNHEINTNALNFNKLLKVVFGVFSLKILTVVTGFFGTLILTRLLGAEQIGEYFWLLSSIAILATFIRLGQENIIVKQIGALDKAHKNNLAAGIVFFAMRKSLIFSAFMFVLGIIVYFFFDELLGRYASVIPILLICSLLSALVSLFSFGLQGLNLAMMQVVLNSFPRIVIFMIALVYLFFSFELSLNLLFKFLIVSFSVTILFALLVYKIKHIPIYNTQVCKANRPKSYDAISQFYWVSLASILMAEAATVLLGLLSSSEQVAYFSIAIKLVSITSFILIAFNSVLSPQFSKFHAQNKSKELIALFQKTRRYGVGISIPILLFIFYFSDFILKVFGTEFENAVNVLRVLLIAHFFKVFVGSVGQLLLMTGHVYYQRLCLKTAVTLLIILCVMLCPLYGALGASIATLVAVMCNNLMGLYFVNQKLNIPYFLKTKVFTSHA